MVVRISVAGDIKRMETPGQRLQEARLKLGKQQKEVATEIHKALATYKSWEQDRTRPRTFSDIISVCKAVNLPVQEYITGEEWDMELPDMERRAVEALKQLPPEMQLMIVMLLEQMVSKMRE